jgi:hypothetical protein
MKLALLATAKLHEGNTFNYPTLAECYRVAGLNGYNKIAAAAG